MRKYTGEFYIKFEDIDAAGWLFYPRFFEICHNLFEDCFNSQVLFSYAAMIKKKNIGLPIVQISAKYYSPLQHGDMALASFKVSNISQHSFTSEFDIFKKEGQILSFQAKITNVCINFTTKKSMKIPKSIRNFLMFNDKVFNDKV